MLGAAWLALPLAAGPALAEAFRARSGAVAAVATALLLAGWGAGVVAVLVPRSVGLTALRVLAPAAVVAAVWSSAVAPGPAAATGAAWSAVTAALVLLVPAVADRLVDGSSYGPERRMALRLPAPLLAGPVELSWAAVVGGTVAGPLLLAARQWAAGAVAVPVGAVVVVVGLRSLHGLSRRWAVFVPAGLVLHDPLVMAEPVLVPRRMVRSLGPAIAGTEDGALDITGAAPGLVLDLALGQEVTVGLRGTGRRARQARSVNADRLLFTPCRPGALLAEARQRSLPVAVPPPTTSSPS